MNATTLGVSGALPRRRPLVISSSTVKRSLFVTLASLWQIAAYQIRPVIGDKAAYVSMAEAIPVSDSWHLLYKEPLFASMSKLAFEAGQMSSFSFDSGVGLINIIASILVAVGLARMTTGSNRDLLLLLPLFFLYDFIYLSAETIRAHLGMGFFLLYLAGRRSGRHSLVYGTAAVLTHFSLFLPFMALEFFRARLALRVTMLVVGLAGAAIAAVAIGFDDLKLLLEVVAGASIETARKFPEVRAYVIPLFVLGLLLWYRAGVNSEIKIVACVFTVLTPTLYLLGATEIALRAFSAAMLFMTLLFTLHRGRLTVAAQFAVLMTLVLLYTAVSPLSLLYGF